MTDASLAEVRRLLVAANAGRGRAAGAPDVRGAAAAEAALEARFAVGRALAVYGTLAPGRPNHHVVAPLGGTWTRGIVEGDFHASGWGASLGYPALRPRAGAPAVPVHVLVSPALPAAWPALDAFEGPGYRRVLVPVLAPDDPDVLLAVANLYAAVGAPDDAAPGDAADHGADGRADA